MCATGAGVQASREGMVKTRSNTQPGVAFEKFLRHRSFLIHTYELLELFRFLIHPLFAEISVKRSDTKMVNMDQSWVNRNQTLSLKKLATQVVPNCRGACALVGFPVCPQSAWFSANRYRYEQTDIYEAFLFLGCCSKGG